MKDENNIYAIDNNGDKVKLGDIVECISKNNLPIVNSLKLGVVINIINENNISVNGLNQRHHGARFSKFVKHTDQSLSINNSIAYDTLIRKNAIDVNLHLQDIVNTYKKDSENKSNINLSKLTIKRYERLSRKYSNMLRSSKLNILIK